MLFISIPNGETAGTCRINGKPCKFTIADRVFSFRPAGSGGEWDRRHIVDATEGERLTNYICASKGGFAFKGVTYNGTT
jgi:hypothetical protein